MSTWILTVPHDWESSDERPAAVSLMFSEAAMGVGVVTQGLFDVLFSPGETAREVADDGRAPCGVG